MRALTPGIPSLLESPRGFPGSRSMRGEFFTFGSLDALRARVAGLGLADAIGFADDVSPGRPTRAISAPVRFGPFHLRNALATHPMEGWDGDAATGAPTATVLRRWKRMGSSGAALIWGVEAFAVDFPYRANANQLVMVPANTGAIAKGLRLIRKAAGAPVVVGAQLTCSGRWSHGGPFLMHHHPDLDRRVRDGATRPLMTDAQVEDVAGLYERAAHTAREAGFDFVDVKACHGYWLNEALAAKTRDGRYGGELPSRVQPLLLAVDAARRGTDPAFPIGVRLSMFDGIPFEEDPDFRMPGLRGRGRPAACPLPYRWGFGTSEDDPTVPDPAEPLEVMGLLADRGVRMFNLSCGCPYANSHLLRPTETPPVDAYQPHHDPLHEVAIHFRLAALAKQRCPAASIVGAGYSYLRGFKFHAAEYNLSAGLADAAGLGRALLSYPDEIRRVLETGVAASAKGRVVCTGDSACTTGPRLGFTSGCVYDPAYAEVVRDMNARLAGMGLRRK